MRIKKAQCSVIHSDEEGENYVRFLTAHGPKGGRGRGREGERERERERERES